MFLIKIDSVILSSFALSVHLNNCSTTKTEEESPRIFSTVIDMLVLQTFRISSFNYNNSTAMQRTSVPLRLKVRTHELDEIISFDLHDALVLELSKVNVNVQEVIPAK